MGKDKGELRVFWNHVYLKEISGPVAGVINPDSGSSILDSERRK
jgi:hypothetical protein